MIIMTVIGLTVLAASRTGLACTCVNTCAVTSPAIMVGVQPGDGSVCVICVETSEIVKPAPAAVSAAADIIQQLPDMSTLVLLGMGGLLYRRRKQ